MAGSWFAWGTEVVLTVQHWGAWLSAPMHFFSFLGTEEFFLLLLPLLYWCVDARLGLRIGAALLTASALNAALKMGLHTPRPFWYSSQVHPLALETSFGAPSGHAQAAAAVWGMAAHDLGKRWFRWLAAAVIFLIGLSRLYLGVHFPHDVLLGWLCGGLILWGLLALWPHLTRHLAQAGTAHRIAAAMLGSLLLLAVNWVAWWTQRGFVLPASWSETAGIALTPVSLKTGLTSAGVFFGFFLGYVLAAPLNFQPQKGALWRKGLRYLLGLAGLVALWAGLGALFPHGETLAAWGLRYLRYALIGLWVSYGAPRAFRWLRLE